MLANAFLCGIHNSLISTLEGFLFIVKSPFIVHEKAINLTEFSLEQIDEFIQNFFDFKYAIVQKEMMEIWKKILNKISNISLSKIIGNTSMAEIAYFIGAVVEFIIEIILGILITGGVSPAVQKAF